MPLEPPRDLADASRSAAARRDDDIVALLALGDAELAFERLAARYAPKIYRLCLAMLREPARAEDAAQDSLLRAWRALGSYQPKAGALSTWLYAITRNRCLTLLERAGPVAASIDDDAVLAEVAGLGAPEDAVSRADGGHALLRRLVEALPSTQRQALTLYYFEERSVAEAAAMLGLPEATLKTHLHRGREKLRLRLAAEGLADPSLWA